ncbi:MAG: ParB/RepB/Spo0J family partition protein [Treponema sp.]|nr:ParB/RepB/Spo0J family partition protein [Treponema sp.]
MAPKHGLGKGLDALFPQDHFDRPDPPDGSADAESRNSGWELFLSLDRLKPNADQPRKYFDEEELRELADSIREHGIIEPVIAEDSGNGNYTIVAGERRCRAARLAGLSRVPAIVRAYSDEKRMEVSLVENLHRADLNPIEEALAYKRLMEVSGFSQDELAAKVGKNRSTVANALRLLKLPEAVRDSLKKGTLSPGHARAILAVSGEKNQELLYSEIMSKDLSVREAEKRALDLNNGKKTAKKGSVSSPVKRSPELEAMEEKFIEKLGTKVVIDGDLSKGRIHIDYYSMEDLERLYEILGG